MSCTSDPRRSAQKHDRRKAVVLFCVCRKPANAAAHLSVRGFFLHPPPRRRIGWPEAACKKEETAMEQYTAALAGNPNVGKSTVFNLALIHI